MAIPASSAAVLIKSLLLIGTVPFIAPRAPSFYGKWKTRKAPWSSAPPALRSRSDGAENERNLM
jgi:hypothetical protein